MAVDPVVQDFVARSMAENNRSLMSEMSTLITNSVESIKRSNSEAVEDRLREIKKMRRSNAVRLLHLDAIGSRFIHVRSRIFLQNLGAVLLAENLGIGGLNVRWCVLLLLLSLGRIHDCAQMTKVSHIFLCFALRLTDKKNWGYVLSFAMI